MKPSYEQIEVLVEFLERHRHLAAGALRTTDARRKAKQLWASIAARLNGIGGDQRNGQNWNKYWVDKKSYLKKIAKNRIAAAQMGGDGADTAPISDLDQRMLRLLGPNYVIGDHCKNSSESQAHAGNASDSRLSCSEQSALDGPDHNPTLVNISFPYDDSNSSSANKEQKSATLSGATLASETAWLQEIERRRLTLEEQRLDVERRRLRCEWRQARVQADRLSDIVHVARDLNATFARIADGLAALAGKGSE